MNVTLEDIQTLIGIQMGIRTIEADARLMEDLGAESADMVNIFAATEDKFKISFGEAELAEVRTARQLLALTNKTLQASQ